MQGSDGSKNVPLEEGCVTDVKIEVTAEDGTVRVYVVHATRTSPKDAALSALKISAGKLDPVFSPDIKEYFCKALQFQYHWVTLFQS